MTAVIIDRRKNDKGKSSVNRRKFISRVKGILKDGVKDLVRDGNIRDLVTSGGKKVRVPARNLEEPTFHHDDTGVRDLVRPGNDRYVPGDKWRRKPQGRGLGNGASADGDGEDAFTFHLTKDEFLELFFENCELPDLVKQNLAILTEEVMQRHGFTSESSPAMLNIMRSMRNAKGRRSGLRAMKTKKLRALEQQEQDLIKEISTRQRAGLDVSVEQTALERVRKDIEVVKRRIKAVPFLDPLDLKYNNWTKASIPKAQAAMVCLMDVSGSMDERKKELAKTFYLLLYLFLTRDYDHIAIEWITYHSTAQVVTEDEFFYGHETGGTVTSVGLELACETIAEKYPPALWNVYLAHASDGDNYGDDNVVVKDIVTEKLLPTLQYYAYVQINPDELSHLSFGDEDDKLWSIYHPLSEQHRNVGAGMIATESDVYPVFTKLFEKKK